MKRFLPWMGAVFVSMMALSAFAAEADVYPSHPIKLVVPYAPGGTTDVLARLIAANLSEKLGQQVIVENKPGGGNNIGTEYVVNSAPDGYTMLLANPANGINTTLYPKLHFNFLRDIDAVAGIVRTPNVMAITKVNLPVNNVAEFIAYCKANPGKINMASSGSGTSVHLSGELFKSMSGCDMTHVPYKGAGPALTDLIAGQVQVMFDNLPSSAPHINGGRLKAIGMTSAKREPSMPDVPSIGETIPDYEATAWFGLAMPKGSPKAAINRINAEVNKALAEPKMRERLLELGGLPIPGTPEDFGKTIADETKKWAVVVKQSGATAD